MRTRAIAFGMTWFEIVVVLGLAVIINSVLAIERRVRAISAVLHTEDRL